MAASNLYQDLKNALTEFKTFLAANAAQIKPAIQALKSVVPQVGDLVTKLVELMTSIKTEIQNLDVSNVPGLTQLSAFTNAAKTLLTTAKSLVPDKEADINEVLSVVEVVSGLPTLDTVKQDIIKLLDDIIGLLNSLNA
jgi:ABC-type transporter Mla subunit MlaD